MRQRGRIWAGLGLALAVALPTAAWVQGEGDGLRGVLERIPGVGAVLEALTGRSPDTVGLGPTQVAGPFRVQVAVDPDPPRVGPNRVVIQVLDPAGEPIAGARVRAVAQMPAMGTMAAMHAPAEIHETAPGRYEGAFELSMSGEWPLAVDVEAEAGHGDLIFDMATGRKGLELATATPGDIAHYTCSMHPSVKSAIPGTCPICAMDLVPVTRAEQASGAIRVDARRRQLIGVTLGKVERRVLTQTIRAAGRVRFDETRLSDVSLKFDAWIGTLRADYVGAEVHKGQVLFTVYSPDLVAAQEEYLLALRRHGRGGDTLAAASRRRLAQWDIGPAQIRALERRGQAVQYLPMLSPATGTVIEKHIVQGSAVKAGMRLLRIADLSRVWVEGQVYEYELPYVKAGMAAQVVLPEMNRMGLPGKVAYVYPYLEGDTRTARIRVELDNRDGVLRPDMYAHVYLEVDLGERLVVPEGAVLYSGESRVVFVDLGEGRLQPRRIRTGLRSGDHIEVLEGLQEGERVVTSGNFLIAAESKLKSGIDQW